MVNEAVKLSLGNLIENGALFYSSLVDLSILESNLGCIDGKIIGTGQSDYTQSSTEYNLNVDGRQFVLIDIPGIEGDEHKYKQIIEDSLAKAHIIFYVNGSNKKPEKHTLEKIKNYMHDGTSVYALFNVHHKAKMNRAEGIDKSYPEALAEAYEIQNEIAIQTEKQLKSFLERNFKGSVLLNGLLSFSAVAIDSDGYSTIANEANKGLRRDQSVILKDYSGNLEQMKTDSRIQNVQNIIVQKIECFDEYIFEENIKKLKIRLRDMLAEVMQLKSCEEKKIRSFFRDYDSFEKNCTMAKDDFVHSIKMIGRNVVEKSFFTVREELFEAIEKKKGRIKSEEIATIFNRHRMQITDDIRAGINKKIDAAISEYQELVQDAEKRLCRDLQRGQIQFEIAMNGDLISIDTSFGNALGIRAKDVAKGVLDIAGLAYSGFLAGSIFPGLGNVIGAVVGFLLGVGSKIWNFFASESKRINHAKAELNAAIEEQIDSISEALKKEIKELNIVSAITEKHDGIKKRIEEQRRALHHIESMLDVVAMNLDNKYKELENYKFKGK